MRLDAARPRHTIEYRKGALAIAIAFGIFSISLGSARADKHDRDGQRYGNHGGGHREDNHGRGWRGNDGDVRYYAPVPEVYYAPPTVVYAPPRPSWGVSWFFPIWIR